MEELSPDDLQQLEEELYSKVHHSFEDKSSEQTKNNTNLEKNLNTSKFLSKRYWTNKSTDETAQQTAGTINEPKNNFPNKTYKSTNNNNNINNMKRTQTINQSHDVAEDNESLAKETNPNHRNKIRNPFAQPDNCRFDKNKNKKPQNNSSQRNQNNRVGGPFAEKLQKIQRVNQIHNKKQKANNARAKMLAKPKIVETISLDLDSDANDDDDEVIVVPTPPTPVVSIEDSDEEMLTPIDVAQQANVKLGTAATDASRCTSPASIMSHDDFIGQKDRQRLLMVNDNVDSFLEAPTTSPIAQDNHSNRRMSADDIECIGTFIKPRTLMSNAKETVAEKQDYRVGGLEFRATDVYESESDIVSDGVYSKGSSKTLLLNTATIQTLVDSSDDDMNDISLNPSKTKRLRKRRASNTNCADAVDSDCENEGVVETGVPFIYRGPALESFKPKRKRKRTSTGRMSDTEFVATLNSIAKGDNNNGNENHDVDDDSESDSHGNMPTARDIAERVLNTNETTKVPCDDVIEVSSTPKENVQNDEAVPNETDCLPVTTISDNESDAVIEIGVPVTNDDQALQSQKSKKKRKCTSTGLMSDTKSVPTSNSIAKEGNNNENKHHGVEHGDSSSDVIIEVPCMCTENAHNDEAIPAQIADNVEKIMSKISELKEKEKKAQEEMTDENGEDFNMSTETNLSAVSDESTTAVNVKSAEKETDEDEGNKIKYFFAYSPANNECVSDGFGWNEEMRRFYNYSWGGENFREDIVLRSMKRSPHLWRISNVDRFPSIIARGKREKCVNCLSFGHSRSKCPKPKRPLVCYMCGESGHLEARCPNTRCLRCGSETMSYVPSCKRCMYWNNRICPICKLRGHSLNDCPDKWRRYHSTIKPNEFPNSKVVYNRRRYCCFCGMRGHLSDECRKAVYRTEYPIISNEIKSFEKSYDDVILSSYPPPGIKCRLLYDPNLAVNFTLAEKTTRNQTYGRFLNAVGLGRLIGAKNKHEKLNTINPAAVTITGNVLLRSSDKVVEVVQAKTTTAEKSKPNTLNKSTTHATTTESASTSRSNMPPPPAPPILAPTDFDSDSNYSFSEHFEVTSTVEQVPESAVTEPLPDFISLDGGNRYNETSNTLQIEDASHLGISCKFVEAHSDDDREMDVATDVSHVVDKEKPCVAKIFISNERYMFFQSKAGQEYLCKVLPEHDLTGSLEKTSAGYALFLTGLPKNQENLQQALLKKFEELNNTKVQQQIDNQVPKNVKPLIRFLRDSINQLHNNLGSATDLYKKLYDLERRQTKSGMKSADRVRRTLNMIFLGQAGLQNGDNHFEVLLKALRKLLSDFQNKEKVPQKFREEINASWRMLFTSYDHKSYANLLTAYIQLPAIKRNRIPALQIEPTISGMPVLDVSLSNQQKERLNDFAKNVQIKTEKTSNQEPGQESRLMLNVAVPEQQDQSKHQTSNKKLATQSEILSATKKESKQTLESTGTNVAAGVVQQKKIELPLSTTTKKSNISNVGENLANKNAQSGTAIEANSTNPTEETKSDVDHPFCQTLLECVEESFNSPESGHRKDCSKIPSQFWSTKCKELLLKIIEVAKLTKSSNLGRFENIYKLSTEGKLSFINHSDLLKIYKRVVKK